MSWANLATNQTISFDNLKNAVANSVFTPKTTIPVGAEQITKLDADTYVDINPSFTPFAVKTNSQLVVKNDLQPPPGVTQTQTPSNSPTPSNTATPTRTPTRTPTPTPVYSCFTIFFRTDTGTGWDSSSEACYSVGSPRTVCVLGTYATLNAAYLDGKALYTNNTFTTLFTSNNKWFQDGTTGNVFQLGNDGFIQAYSTCPTQTPTNTRTPTQTPTSSPCPCICGAIINNTSGGSITGTWTDCYDVVQSFTLGVGASLVIPCAPELGFEYIKYNSVTANGSFSVSYGTCSTAPTQTPTQTPTPTQTQTPTPSSPLFSTIQWDFSEIAGGDGSMEIYVNGNIIANPFTTSNGTYNVVVGDTIDIAVTCFQCFSPNDYSNAYSISNKSILSDAACTQSGTASIFTSAYTVVSGDVGNQINVSGYAECASGCI
jgi:hypothetical protein